MNDKRFISASNILLLPEDAPEHPVLVFEGDRLTDIVPGRDMDPSIVELYNGTLIPGFVNAHCHLELSHMKGKVDTGTGLTPFLNAVVTQPPVPEELIEEAIREADLEMWESGIVAVGDISNKSVTAEVKMTSPIEYYTFVEMFDFLDPGRSEEYYDQYNEVYEIFLETGLKNVSRVPHSPYTVSADLSRKLAESLSSGLTGSIHMLENQQENILLRGGPSEYADFFHSLGFGLDHFIAPGHGSIEHFLQYGYHPERMLFVHNTIADQSDLEKMKLFSQVSQPYLVTCPNANLYIESTLPQYDKWLDSGLQICIGTDSYSSNHQLSIWDEMRTIKSNFDFISWDKLIRWACINGARALGMEDRFGSFDVGKTPGVVLLGHRNDEPIGLDSIPRKII